MNLYDLTIEELTELVKSWGEPAYRAKQIWEWLYTHKVSDPAQMSSLPQKLRDMLQAQVQIGVLENVVENHSTDGQTTKHLFKLQDGQLIEAVLMEYDDDRNTACISTQAGCAMACVFCATGQMGFARNLSAGEIVEQALWFARDLQNRGERLSNVVLMGMGEPLHNYDETMQAIRLLNSPQGLGIGQRHITVSTVGLVPAIRRFADEGMEVRLAVSLHAATDEERDALLPINRRYKLAELMDACAYYVEQSGRRISFEWALIAGKTDTLEQAEKLGKLIHKLKCHVNVIPLNPTEGYDGKPSKPQDVQAFIDKLAEFGVPATIRVRRGIDINAGCGQLKAEVIRKQK